MTLDAPFVPFMMKILLIYYRNAKKHKILLQNWQTGFKILTFNVLFQEYFIYGLQKERMASKTLNFIFYMQNISPIVHAAINKHYYLAYLREKKLLFMYKVHMEIALSNNK